MKNFHTFPNFVKKKFISLQMSLRSSVFAILSLLEILPRLSKSKSRFGMNTRILAGLLIKSTGCGRPLKADEVNPRFHLKKNIKH